jgi:NAD(P)-dependent dehydrogenase (short-subunit alcohol dehydrogenase family)
MKLREPPVASMTMLPMDIFAGQVAIVTGGGTGLGLAMASALARCGASIGIIGRSIENLEKGHARLTALGAKVCMATADVRDAAQVAAAFDVIEAELGPASILANNAGANFPVLADKMSPNAWRAVVQIALDGTFFCSTEFYRRRMKLGLPGVIVNNGATYAWTGFPGDAHSCAAKAGAMNLTQTLATEWAADGIRVNCVVAGFYPHERSPSYDPGNPDGIRGMAPPAQRSGREQEYGWAAAYLCSPYSAYVTGLNLVIDGGEWLRRDVLMPDFVPLRERAVVW